MQPTTFFVFLAVLPTVTFAEFIECGRQSENYKPTQAPVNSAFKSDFNLASPHSWPWRVLLVTNTLQGYITKCGGNLLRARVNRQESDIVVTNAHCVTTEESRGTFNPVKYDANLTTVIIGAHNLDNDTDGRENVKAAEIRVHPGYKLNVHHDIALVKLAKPVKFSGTVRPICLPAKDGKFPEDRCTVAGWGSTAGRTRDSSAFLRQLSVKVHGSETCRKNEYGGWAGTFKKEEMVCAGALEGADDVCPGDSGAMLACEENGKYNLYGALSFGYGDDDCTVPGKPKVFTRVGSYKEWIEGEIKKLTSVRGGQEFLLGRLPTILKTW